MTAADTTFARFLFAAPDQPGLVAQLAGFFYIREAPPIINVHHGFLPAFQGARPYHQAHARG